jgi:hypothetical protein
LYRTDDYGKSWTLLTDGKNGIPNDEPTRVVREDPEREGLLYAGTEFGMYISFDNGKVWQSFQQNLPVTPVTDIKVHRKDLVISTMGRAFWIMDDVSPLHQITEAVAASAATLFKPATAIRTRRAGGGRPGASPEYTAPAAQIDYVLAAEPAGDLDLKLEILDSADKVIRTVTSRAGRPDAQAGRGAALGDDEEMRGPRFGGAAASLTKRAGHNRFAWDFRYDGFGPLALPGKYKVRLSADGLNQTVPLEVTLDPRLAKDGVTVADLKEQLDLLLAVRDVISDARRTLQGIDAAIKKSAGQASDQAGKLQKLQALRSQLATAPITYPQPMLIDQLGSLSRMAGSADRKVGRSAIEYFEVLKKQLAGIKNELRTLVPE